MKHEPGVKDDAKNLSLISGSAMVAVLLTAGFLFANRPQPEQQNVVVRIVPEVPAIPVVVPEPAPAPEPAAEPLRFMVRTPLTGSHRLYGTVHTTRGEQLTGYIRWDRNEGSITDLLDAYKSSSVSGTTISGIRFGHIASIESLGSRGAMFTLKSGDRVRFDSYSTDLGSGLRALIVDGEDGRHAQLGWRQLQRVDLSPPPASSRPAEGRLFGTLTTRGGMEFTGFITWDVDEIYSSDVLDGDLNGEDLEIPFGSIESIERFDSRSALVTLHSGEEMILDGSEDVNNTNAGISVSDVNLGQVKLPWSEFDRVVFHGTQDEVTTAFFDGGRQLEGTVITESGEEISGSIRWDNDETSTWEMLDGDIRGIEFDVEFSNIDKITKSRSGAVVTLRDGRTFELSGSNDVDSGNRGIVVSDDGRTYQVRWSDFRELRLAR